MQLHPQRDHPPCPAATTYRGDQRWLGRLRTVGLVLPLVFLVALQALHLFVVRPFLPQGGEWAVTGVAALIDAQQPNCLRVSVDYLIRSHNQPANLVYPFFLK